MGKSRSLTIGAVSLALAGSLGVAAPRQQVVTAFAIEQKSGTHEALLSISTAGRDIAWVGGEHGTFARTTNGGKTWTTGRVPGAEDLAFRDVYAVNGSNAFVMSVGVGKSARIYKTSDGGKHWMPKFMNIDPMIQWKCFSFWSPDSGVVLSDAVRGAFVAMVTMDGGEHWDRPEYTAFPDTYVDERMATLNGGCVTSGPGGRAWFATTKMRVFRTMNYGDHWRMAWVNMPMVDSTVASIAFRDKYNGIAFGKIALMPSDSVIAVTSDGGASWTARAPKPLMDEVSASAYVPELSGPTVVVVGPRGATFSRDEGVTWERIDSVDYRAVAFAWRKAGWAVGANGRITKITF